MLDPAFVPEPNRAVDAYKKATSEVDDYEYRLPNNTTAAVLVRDVVSNGEVIVRHLIREVRDQRRKRLDHGKIGEAVFYRPSMQGKRVVPGSERFRLSVDKELLNKDERPAVQGLVDKVNASYARYHDYMDGMKVRAMVRDYVKHLNAVTIKAGVYFVHVSRRDELQRLQELVSRLGHGCSMELIPLVDLDEQRDMVVDAFQTEAEKALQEVVRQIAHIRSTRKTVTPDAYAKLKREYDSVIMRATEYTRTLNISQDRTAGAAEIALEQLAELQRNMLGGAA
jgi:hypothetical protein